MKRKRTLRIIIGTVLLLIAASFFIFYFEKNFFSRLLPAKENVSNQTQDGAMKKIKRKVRRLTASENPGYAEAFAEAERFANAGKFSDALLSYTKASLVEPKAIEPLMRMGNISLALTEYDQAEKYFKQAKDIAPKDTSITLALAQTAIKKRDLATADQLLMTIDPPLDQSLFYQALIATMLNQSDTAKQLLQRLIDVSKNPTLKEQAQLILNQYQIFALNRGGKIVHLQALLANTLNEIGEEELALALAFEALKFKHNYRDIWLIIGHASLKLGKFKDAKDALEKAVQLDSQKPEGYFFLGIADKELKKWPDAKKNLNRAMQLGFKPPVYVNQQLAPVLFELQEYDESLATYEKILQFNATDIDLFVKPIEIALQKLNNIEKALELAEWAVQVHQDEALAYNLRGWAKLEANRLEEAKKDFEHALQLDPNMPQAKYRLALVEEKEGNLNQAFNLYLNAYKDAQSRGEIEIGNLAQQRYENIRLRLTENTTQ